MSILLPNDGGIAQPNNILNGNMIPIDQLIIQIATQVFSHLSSCKIRVKCKKLSDTAQLPKYNHDSDTCADIYSDVDIVLEPESVTKVSTGIACELPDGFYLRILSRSGLASNGIVTVGGVCDNSYRGEIIVMLHNTTKERYEIHKGDRIAQLEIRNFHQMDIEEVTTLSTTERNDKGFGSSGV